MVKGIGERRLKLNDYEKTDRKKLPFYYLYIFAYLLVIVICAESEALTNNGVVIPFVRMNQAYPLLVVTFLGVVYTLLKKYIKVDDITLLLIGRIILCFLPTLFYDMPSSYIGNFAVSCFPLLIYIFFLNCDIDIEKGTCILLWFGLVIAIQCIWAYLEIQQNGFATYNDLFYKNYFVIPIGATNNISAILLPLMIIGDQTIDSRKYRIIYVLFLLFALCLCKSRTGLIMAVLYLIVKLFIKERGKHATLKKVLICFLPLIILVVTINLMGTSIWNSIYSLMLGYSSAEDGINSLLSGRIGVFENVIENIKDHPIFGNGVTYEKLGFVRSHNVFLQILYENGIIGLLGFITFLTISIHSIIKAKSINRFYYAFYIAMPFVLINAIVEETLLGHFMVLFGLLYLADIKKAIRR